MKLISRPSRTNPFKKCFAFVFEYFDIILICFLLVGLKDYQYYYDDFLHPPHSDKWWKWPTYEKRDLNKNLSNQGRLFPAARPSQAIETNNDKFKPLEIPKPAPSNEANKKMIVFSHPPHGKRIPYPVDEEGCGGKCEVTYDTRLWNNADAVLFHITDKNPMPKRSFPNQLYVWINEESPSTTLVSRHINFHEYDNSFNMTMTYRRDSDIYWPYNTLYNISKVIKKTKELKDIDLLLASKDKLGIWVAGNCAYTKGGAARMRIMLNFLLLGLKFDTFGYCVLRLLPGSWDELPEQVRRYKFYFAFENSLHCRDYITEKAWGNALVGGAVPVIWGPLKADVEAILPKGSFIFAEDFNTQDELVKYLHYLDGDMKAYREYFNWRVEDVPEHIPDRTRKDPWLSPKVVGFCQLCYTLYEDEKYFNKHGQMPKRKVESLSTWWYAKETDTCLMNRRIWEIGKAFWYRKLFIQEYYFQTLSCVKYYAPIYIFLILFLIIRRLRLLQKDKLFKIRHVFFCDYAYRSCMKLRFFCTWFC